MLTRRALAGVRSVLSAPQTTVVRSRDFTVSAVAQGSTRPPALADITPTSAASFTQKQKEFRESLITAQKRKEQEESASISNLGLRCVQLWALSPTIS